MSGAVFEIFIVSQVAKDYLTEALKRTSIFGEQSLEKRTKLSINNERFKAAIDQSYLEEVLRTAA